MKNFLIGTGNRGKLGEILEVLGTLPFNFVTPHDLQLNSEIDEDAETYEENALKKAKHYFDQCRHLTLAEDSGIVVDALADELGVKTRRWGAGEAASDEEWIAYFMKRMESVPEDKRTARFICCAALVDDGGQHYFFRGETEGIITSALEAPIRAGLPISSCFRPSGFREVYAALPLDEKNRISHRGKAMHAVREWVMKLPDLFFEEET